MGNEAFTEKQIQDDFELHTPNWLSWYRQERSLLARIPARRPGEAALLLHGRGYANFAIDSSQVTIAPEKDDIFITVNVNEGESSR